MRFIEEKIKIILDTLEKKRVVLSVPLTDIEYTKSGYTTDNIPPGDGEWCPLTEDTEFREKDAHYWFHLWFRTMERKEQKTPYFQLYTSEYLRWDMENPQILIFEDGIPVQGLDVNHQQYVLEYDKEYDLYLYLYKKDDNTISEFIPSIILIDDAIDRLYYDMKVPFDCAKLMEKESQSYIKIMTALNETEKLLDLRNTYSDDFYDGIQKATQYMQTEFYESTCGETAPTVSCVGHSHIDIAWLWTLAQTREKAQRSFSTVIKLMERYPEYIYMSSQPQLYKYVKDAAPALYNKIKDAVRTGRWEPEGAMWLEADCNLTSGESIIRQILFGKRFFRQEFGTDSHILWLPDAFGYSAALPQIMKKCGIDTFVTSKISWNETNKMPYDTFVWQGIDGSEVFTYFLTAQAYKKDLPAENYTTYIGLLQPDYIRGTWNRYQQKELNDETLITFGYGDGGGGPTEEMLKMYRRLRYGIPGMPRTQMSSVSDFIGRIKKNFYNNAKKMNYIPKWVGELYLELHRGTYTSMAKNKRNNRKSEQLYKCAEIFSVMAHTLLNHTYDRQKINSGWEKILTNQFHDILPGSSIREVYEDSDKDYEYIISNGEEILESAADCIVRNISSDKEIVVFNPHSYTCSDIVSVEGRKVYAENIPPLGWKAIDIKPCTNNVKVDKNVMENQFYRVVINEIGGITSCFDKEADREMIQKGQTANNFYAYEDYPKAFDAWEISSYYADKKWAVDDVISVEPIKEELRSGFKILKRFGKSEICQRIYLYENIKRIDFETVADWHEEHILLKAEFPLNIHTEEMICETQFGNVKRPTHQNTSWDSAKFEVCAHKWVDLSEANYGIALLNDCKYGHSINGSVLALTLLKCATEPNEIADKGRHEFRYALYSHASAFEQSNVVREAYTFNIPMYALRTTGKTGGLCDEYSFVQTNSNDVIIETVKMAEDDDGVIIRLYETKNQSENITLSFGKKIERAALCAMTEEEENEVLLCNNEINLNVKPFEIVTLKVQVQKSDTIDNGVCLCGVDFYE